MNLKLLCMAAIGLFWMSTGIAQDKKKESSADLAIATNSEAFSFAINWNRLHALGTKQKFKIGYGVRASAFQGSNLDYTTAPLNLSKEETSTDNYMLGSASTFAINAMLQANYGFNDKWSVGFNIDALGIGFGPSQVGVFSSTENPSFNGSYSASPTSFNLLLGGNNDLGQLKSEMYIAYAVSDKLKIRAGFDYTFSEYTTGQKLAHDNDRFRHKAAMFFIALSKPL